EASARIAGWLADGHAPGVAAGASETRAERPVFVFSGMGPQWWGMGRELLRDEPVFRAFAEKADALFVKLAGWSVLEELARDEATSRVTETQIAQPANFILQSGLAALWRSWGVEPSAVVGHSVGEVSSAYVSGKLSLEDAILVSYHRSRVQKKAAGQGGMLAVGLSEADVTPFLLEHHGRVSLAAANGPTSLTLAGEQDALDEIAAELTKDGVFNRALQVEMGYHSPFMEPLKPELRAALAGVRPAAAELEVYSTVTGRVAEDDAFDAEYWCRNIREPVFFAKAIGALIDAGHRLFLEVGPHPVLSTSLKQCLAAHGVEGRVLSSLRRGQPEAETAREGLAGLYAAGSPIDWVGVNGGRGRHVDLPSYPWRRERHWSEGEDAFADRLGAAEHPLLGAPSAGPAIGWDGRVSPVTLPFVPDHVVEDLVVLPGAAYVELGLAAHRAAGGGETALLENLSFRQALVVDGADAPRLRVDYHEDTRTYGVFSRATGADRWTAHAGGRLSFAPLETPEPIALDALKRRFPKVRSAAEHYDEMAGRGLTYGPHFQGVRELRLSEDGTEALAFIAPHAAVEEAYRLHPTLLDACFQTLLGTVAVKDDADVYVPTDIQEIHWFGAPREGFWCHSRRTRHGGGELAGDIVLYGADGATLVEVRDVRAQALTRKADGAGDEAAGWLYQLVWRDGELSAPRSA
ncbi:acyltransferase domain-containing protein, partial [Methylopila musalis]